MNALTKYYKEIFFDGASVLDICSSWVSHFPKDVKLGRTAGIGMNEFELSKNQQLKEFVVQVTHDFMTKIYSLIDEGFEYKPCFPFRK